MSKKNQKTEPSIIFFGTSEFALPALKALIENGYGVAAVVTNPDEPSGRKQTITPPPVKITALEHAIPVLQPEKLSNDESGIKNYGADLFIVAAYGKIIPKEILDIPKFGALNIHPSLLPRWRGPSPVQFTILSGDTEAGVTIMKLDMGMDTGPILAQRELGISNFQYPISKARYAQMHDALAKEGATLLIEILPEYLKGIMAPIPQEDAKATYSKILTKKDGSIIWSRPAIEIERMVRAFTPWPSAWTIWRAGGKTFRVRIDDADATPDMPADKHIAGFVWYNQTHSMLIRTGSGSLIIKKITPEGGTSMSADAFLRGHRNFMNTVLG